MYFLNFNPDERSSAVSSAAVSAFGFFARRCLPMGRRRSLAFSSLLVAMMLGGMVRPESCDAVTANPLPIEQTQPDGTKIVLRIRGDEQLHWFEDLEGFLVMLDSGRYVYAILDAQGQPVPTALAVGSGDPQAAGLAKGIKPSPRAEPLILAAAAGEPPLGVPARGSVKNLVVLCRFSDHVFGTHTRDRADYDVLFNRVGGDPVLAPTGSVKDYFHEASYGTMTLNSTVIAWVTLPHTEAFYGNGSSGRQGDFPNNGQGMVRDALDLADALVNFGDFDTDNDGFVDAITIIHSGYGAETGSGGGNWMWSHRWSLWQAPGGRWTSADRNGSGGNVNVYDYHTEPALWGTSGNGIVRIGVICHETGHFFGLPDLYDTDGSSGGIGSYCLMANSWGFDGTQLHPPHLSAWCKIYLGWITPTVIGPGAYIAPRVETDPTAFRINAGYPSGEYLLIENRQAFGFENVMPQGGGLAIWHVDDNKRDNKEEGYPGQTGWPGNNKHFKIALLPADGRYDLERNVNRGDGGDLFRAGGATVIGPDTTPNTHSYQNGASVATDNRISGISAPGASMSFTYSISSAPAPAITSFNPGSGIIGSTVTITGQNFNGATGVKFNGASATFSAVSATQITATVPAVATTGPITVTTSGGTAGSAASFIVLSSAPTNDNLAGCQTISGRSGSVTGDSDGATKQAGEPNHAGNAGGRSIWYCWTAPASGTVTMDTAGSGFDTLLAVYTGGSVNALTLIAANGDIAAGNLQSRVSFDAVSGTTYRIAVDGFNGASGDVRLNWLLPLPGDQFASCQTITGTSGNISGGSVGASREPGEPFHAGNRGGASIWYCWTAPSSGPVTIDTLGSNFDTLLAVYTGESMNGLTLVAANDDIFGGNTVQSQVAFTVLAGTVYQIAVDGFNGMAGSIVLNWSLSPDPPSILSFAPVSGTPGASVIINGANLGGATVVRFNGVTAGFVANAAGRLTATVPAGAASGPISVVTPGGTTTSAGTFTVTSGFNDLFANCQGIGGNFGTINGLNVGATKEAGEPNHAGNAGGRSVWYCWTAPFGGPVTIDTMGSPFDTLLAVYAGGSVNALTPIASNNDLSAEVRQSRVTFNAASGTTYRIAVDGFNAATGEVTLNWVLSPPNDSFANCETLTGSGGSVNRVNAGATKEPGEPGHAENPGGRSIWFCWTAPSSGPVAFETFGSTFDTLLGVYTGDTLGGLTEVAGNDDFDGLTSLVSFFAVGGTTYRIAVDGFNGTAGNVVLNWTLGLGNNHFANCQVVNGNAGSVGGNNNATATKEAGEPNHAGNIGGRSLWYCWTPPASGSATIDTIDSDFDTVLAVYTGSSLQALTLIASNDDISPTEARSGVSFNALAGVTYRIAVDGFNGASGNVVITWIQAQPNNNFANCQAISGASGQVAGNNFGARRETGEPNHAGNPRGQSIWYCWTATATGPVTFDTLGSSFDTVLAAYTGDSVAALTLHAANDDLATNDPRSRITFNAVAGVTYRIVVEGYDGGAGNLTLNWLVPPPNDQFASCAPINGSRGTASAATAGASKESGEPSHADNPAGRSVWYCWTAPAAGAVTFDTVGSRFDTVLAVYTGNNLAALTSIANNDDLATNSVLSRVTFNASPGVTYRIVVDGFDGDGGNAVLNWLLPPPNDNFSNAAAISGNSGGVSAISEAASKETGEPDHTGNPGGRSLWYRWTAPVTCGVTIDTAGSDIDTLLAVYTGSELAALSTIAANDDFSGPTSRVIINAVAGTSYYIVVDGFNGDAGSVTLNWSVAGECGSPALSYMRQGNQLVLTWSAGNPGFNLESTPAPGSAWSVVLIPPVTLNNQNWVTNLITDPVRFYRLKRP